MRLQYFINKMWTVTFYDAMKMNVFIFTFINKSEKENLVGVICFVCFFIYSNHCFPVTWQIWGCCTVTTCRVVVVFFYFLFFWWEMFRVSEKKILHEWSHVAKHDDVWLRYKRKGINKESTSWRVGSAPVRETDDSAAAPGVLVARMPLWEEHRYGYNSGRASFVSQVGLYSQTQRGCCCAECACLRLAADKLAAAASSARLAYLAPRAAS